jgi:hypothetical protein
MAQAWDQICPAADQAFGIRAAVADCVAGHLSLGRLRPLVFPEAYTGATTVTVDEFNAGQFQSATYC